MTAVAVLMVGCRSPREVVEREYRVDYRPDTVEVQLPQSLQVRELRPAVVARDSLSVLSNDYAESHVELRPDGTLRHQLRTLPQPVRVPVMVRQERAVEKVSAKAEGWRWWQVALALLAATAIIGIIRRG